MRLCICCVSPYPFLFKSPILLATSSLVFSVYNLHDITTPPFVADKCHKTDISLLIKDQNVVIPFKDPTRVFYACFFFTCMRTGNLHQKTP